MNLYKIFTKKKLNYKLNNACSYIFNECKLLQKRYFLVVKST